jgi:hypothetical protein
MTHDSIFRFQLQLAKHDSQLTAHLLRFILLLIIILSCKHWNLITVMNNNYF